MATIFDRETLLDLTVNGIPLAMILFFGVGFLIFNPFRELDLFGMLLAIGLHVVPFVGLAVLTYVSGKAIGGDEKRSDVYFQGQASIEDAQTKEAAEAEMREDGQFGEGRASDEKAARTDDDTNGF